MSGGSGLDRRSRLRRDRGAVLPFVALVMPVLLIMTAFAVDLGRQRSSRRTMQARADIIALDLVRLVGDEKTEAAILPQALTEKAASAERNEIDPAKVDFLYGTWTETSGFIGCRIIPEGAPAPAPSTTCVPNAVRVTAAEEVEYYFRPGDGSTSRSAVASYGEPVAGFSIGSFGANLGNDSGYLSSILTPLLGSPPGIGALSYEGLADADLTAGELATELGLLDPDAALTTDVGTDEMLLAAANVLERNGDFANANVLRAIAVDADAFGPISIGDIVSAESGAEGAALAGSINALDLVTTPVFLSRCTDPDDLATCSAVSLPGITTSLPLLDLDADARIIQGKVSHYGPVGTGTSTNQTEVGITASLGAQEVGQCKPANLLDLKCIVGGLLVNFVDATVSLDVRVKLADASGTIDKIGCTSPEELDVETYTGLYSVVGTAKIDFGRRGLLGGVLGPLLGSLTVTINTSQPDVFDVVAFDVPPDVLGVTEKETGAGDIGLSSVGVGTTGGTGVLGTLGNLGITNGIAPLTNLLLNPLLAQLDSQVLGPMSDILGLNVAGSDITPLEIGCDGQGLKLVG